MSLYCSKIRIYLILSHKSMLVFDNWTTSSFELTLDDQPYVQFLKDQKCKLIHLVSE